MKRTTFPAPTPFTPRLMLGLVGVLIAALASGINDRVTDIALADLLGNFGLGRDEGSWISSAYAAAEVSAMLIAPWLAVTFSLRRFALVATFAFALFGVLSPLAPNYASLLLLRVLQGLAGGFLPPLLMTVALRFLPWHYKLYGLSAYAMTATFGPNLALPLAAVWSEGGDWRLLFWQVVPACGLGGALIAYGLPQDALRLERFAQLDWRGALLGVGGLALLVVGLTQGERLDWLASPLVVVCLLGAAVCLPLFVLNEWFHPLPLFRVQLLARRNFSYGILQLMLFVFIALAGSALPAAYLGHVQGYRPIQTMPLALTIALPQLLIAPLVAWVINRNSVDARYVIALGLGLIAIACLGNAQLTSGWVRDDFYLWQVLQMVGQPMVVVPLLMAATGVIAPQEGPFASAMVNSLRGLGATLAGVALENFTTWREHLHSNHLLDQAMNNRVALPAGASLNLAARVREQAFVLTYADAYLALLAVIGLALLVLLTVPARPYPPQPPVPS